MHAPRATRLPLLLALAACGDEPSASRAEFPSKPSGPPPTMTLTTTPPARGQPFEVTVQGAPPGGDVLLVLSDGALAPDGGACPAPVAPLCLDHTAGPLGYRRVARGSADAAGVFVWSTTLPPAIPPRTFHLQALATAAAGPAESDVAVLDFGASCADGYEPNDDPTTATALTAGVPLAGLVACRGDADWATITVPPGEALSITADFDAADGDLDLELYRDDGALLDWSRRTDAPEEVLWFNADAAPAVVHVLAYAFTDPQGDGVAYALTPVSVIPGACTDDLAEDDDDLTQAVPLSPGLSAARQACDVDSDWWSIDLAANESLTVTPTENDLYGDVGVRLWTPALVELTSGPTDRAVHTATAAERVYVEAVLVQDDVAGEGNAYALDVLVDTVRPCTPDALEPNDSPPLSVVVSSVPYAAVDLAICTADSDWFAIPARAGDTIAVDLWFPVADGDIDATVYSPGNLAIGGGTSSGDNERFTVVAPVDGTYLMRVFGYADYGPPVTGGMAYDLDIDLR